MGRRGVQLLLRRIDGDSGPPVEEVLPHRLRVRDTA
jgi:DNA-binding LacI/PurR family transcriptional regulator